MYEFKVGLHSNSENAQNVMTLAALNMCVSFSPGLVDRSWYVTNNVLDPSWGNIDSNAMPYDQELKKIKLSMHKFK